MSKKQITYLIGAGASAQALPTIGIFNDRLSRYIEWLKKEQKESSLDPSLLEHLISDSIFILQESQKHSTIDTVAKKYFHSYPSKKWELTTLKKVLTTFFLYEQSVYSTYFYPRDIDWTDADNPVSRSTKQGSIDSRYDAFIASLLLSKSAVPSMPTNVNILTWNYDCQLELAFSEFFPEYSFIDVQRLLRVYPILDPISYAPYWNTINNKGFQILHLNGIAHFYTKSKAKEFEYQSYFDIVKRTKLVDTIINLLNSYNSQSNSSNMTFSWEKDSKDNIQQQEVQMIIDAGSKMLQHTDILVVIGYSFPFFNREIDRKLLEGKQFDKVYIQDVYPKAIKEQFMNTFGKNMSDQQVIAYNNIKQFYLPPELDEDVFSSGVGVGFR